MFLLLLLITFASSRQYENQFAADMARVQNQYKEMVRNKNVSFSAGLLTLTCSIRGSFDDYQVKFFIQKDFFELTIEYPENFFFIQTAGRFCRLSQHLNLRFLIPKLLEGLNYPGITPIDFSSPRLSPPGTNGLIINQCENYLTIEALAISKYNPPREAIYFDLPMDFRESLLKKGLDAFSTGQAFVTRHNEKTFMAWNGYLFFTDLGNVVVRRGNANATVSRKLLRTQRSQYVRSFSQLYGLWF